MFDELRAIVGAANVITDADVRAGYEHDWMRRYAGRALAVVRPSSTDEVARVLHVARVNRTPIVPQGGNTGLVGGSVPDASGTAIVVSTERMRRVLAIDELAGQVTVEAGCTLAALDEALAGTAWEFGVDLGGRGSATVGGMASTNAGGMRVLRHGSMRANVLGLEAVLADGRVISKLGGLVKDNTGYDLTGLMVGSEGTLGIITVLRLRLVPRNAIKGVCAIGCSDWGEAMALASLARQRIIQLDSLEAVDAASAAVVSDRLGLSALDHPVTLFVAWAGRSAPWDALTEVVGERASMVAEADADRARLWQYRERIAECIQLFGVPVKLDVTVRLSDVARFAAALPAVVEPHRLHLFGHLGDGNLHVNILGPDLDDHVVADHVLALVAEFGGSISAEHGVGRMKRDYLHLTRSADEIAVMRSVKAALDPLGIMNPGVLV